MNQPKITESLNLYKFDFENSISIELHHLDDKGKAEIWTRWGENGNRKLIDVSELNLLAPRSRDEYCNRLQKLSPGLKDFDYNEAFRWITPLALNAKRKGEPVIELGKADIDIKKPDWDLYPLIVHGMTNIWFGDRGSLKSKLALYAALIMTVSDLDILPLGITSPKNNLSILKLDYEATQDADEYEWHRILRGLDMEGAVQLKYRSCRRPLADDIEAISTHADAVKADVIIVDSLGAAVGTDLNITEPALRFNTALRQLNRTILCTAHTAKNSIGKRSVFGSSFYENMARNIWEVVKAEDEESDASIQHIGLKQTKPPPFSPHHKPLGFQFDFDQESERTIISKYDPNNMDNFMHDLSTTATIISVLRDGQKSDKQIAEETGKTIAEIRVGLFRLKKSKKVEKWNGVWGLLSNEQE